MVDLLILLTSIWAISVSAFANPNTCHEIIKVCDDIKMENLEDVPDEDEIAKNGHWGGIKPIRYHIDFNFSSRSDYKVSTTIQLQAIKATDKIFLNQNPKYLAIDYKKIALEIPCGHSPAPGRCIEVITEFLHIDILAIRVRNYQLQSNLRYKLLIPSSQQTDDKDGFWDFPNHEDQSAVFINHFQQRRARNAFPCMDHPSLKSIYHICVDHPKHFLAASNSIPATKISTNERTRVCFEPTPKLSTYLMTVAIMENYTSEESIPMPGHNFTLELFVPKVTMEELRDLLKLSIPQIQYLTNITGVEFPMKRFGLIIVPGFRGGMEHMGLTTLDGGSYPETSRGKELLFHETVHQWIGDIVTISHWREECLQEGLTSYFEWIMSDRSGGQTLSDRLQFARSYAFGSVDPLLRDHNGNTKIPCYHVAPFVFHTITKIMGGFEVFERFLKRLIEKRMYGNADINLWDETMSEVTNGKLKGYIKGWFSLPGPLYLFISEGDNPNEIVIRQRVFHNGSGTFMENAPVLVPVPLQIILPTNEQDQLMSITLSKSEETIQIGPNRAYLLDPDLHTVSIKIYPPKLYLYLLRNQQMLAQRGFLNDERLRTLIEHFCFASTKNAFSEKDKADLKEVSSIIQKLAVEHEIRTCDQLGQEMEKQARSLKNKGFKPY